MTFHRLRRTRPYLCLVVVTALVGCGSPYPEPTVRTAEGHPGTCSECGKEIVLVGEPNMITVGSTRFVVCDAACGAKMTEKMKGQ